PLEHRDPLSFPTRRSSDLLNLDLSALHLDLVVRDRLVGRPVQHLARPNVELAAVAAARHGRAVELTLGQRAAPVRARVVERVERDRKSTRLNSSHVSISYA